MVISRLAFAAIAGCLAFTTPAWADGQQEAALALSQDAIGHSVPDFTFTSADGGTVRLAQFRGKPLLVSLIYTSCANVCPAIIESLANAKTAAEATFGPGSFNILTVGFDTRRDTPDRMRIFARAHNARGDNWLFAASDPASMDRFATAVGFSYFASAGGFDHPAQVTVIDRDGKVFAQVYGGTFAAPAIVEPLKALIFGGARPVFTLAGLGDRIRFFCTVYDSRTGRYYFDYSILLSALIGIICLVGTLYFLVREFRKSVRAGNA